MHVPQVKVMLHACHSGVCAEQGLDNYLSMCSAASKSCDDLGVWFWSTQWGAAGSVLEGSDGLPVEMVSKLWPEG